MRGKASSCAKGGCDETKNSYYINTSWTFESCSCNMIQAFICVTCCVMSLFCFTWFNWIRQAVIRTYLKPLKKYDKKPSRITNHQNGILKKKKRKKKKKLNNLYNYTPTFAFKTHTFAWDDSVVFSFKVTYNGPRRNAQVFDLIPQEILS